MIHDRVSSFYMLACCQQERDTQNAEAQDAMTTSSIHHVQQDNMTNKAQVKVVLHI